jgi:hypothetical protein
MNLDGLSTRRWPDLFQSGSRVVKAPTSGWSDWINRRSSGGAPWRRCAQRGLLGVHQTLPPPTH